MENKAWVREEGKGRSIDLRQEALGGAQVMGVRLSVLKNWREMCSEEGTPIVDMSQKERLKERSIVSW